MDHRYHDPNMTLGVFFQASNNYNEGTVSRLSSQLRVLKLLYIPLNLLE